VTTDDTSLIQGNKNDHLEENSPNLHYDYHYLQPNHCMCQPVGIFASSKLKNELHHKMQGVFLNDQLLIDINLETFIHIFYNIQDTYKSFEHDVIFNNHDIHEFRSFD